MEPRYNEVLGITNDFIYHSNRKIYEEEPRYNETSLWGTNLASPLALRYIEVPLYKGHRTCFCGRAAEIAHHQVPEAIMKFLSHCSGPLNCSSFHFSMLGNSGASIHFKSKSAKTLFQDLFQNKYGTCFNSVLLPFGVPLVDIIYI